MSEIISFDEFKKLDLRIAEILKVEPHPNADRLWLIRVRIGEEERQIVAGIRKAYTAEELIGKKIVMVCNLQPAVIRGVESNGMLLAASAGDDVVLLVPQKDLPSGAIVK